MCVSEPRSVVPIVIPKAPKASEAEAKTLLKDF
jgi:hypothetical protein